MTVRPCGIYSIARALEFRQPTGGVSDLTAALPYRHTATSTVIAGKAKPRLSWNHPKPAAQNAPRFRMKVAKSGLWRAKIQAYSDLSAATLAEMTMQISFGPSTFGFTGTFTEKGKGWQIKRLPLP